MMNKYMCTNCRYIYSPFFGEKETHIEEGTEFEDIDDDWVCPVCGSEKDVFEIMPEQIQILDENLNLDIEERHTPFYVVQGDYCFVRVGRDDVFHTLEDEHDFIGYIMILDDYDDILEIKKFPETDSGQIYKFCLHGNTLGKVLSACSMHGIWEGIEDENLLNECD